MMCRPAISCFFLGGAFASVAVSSVMRQAGQQLTPPAPATHIQADVEQLKMKHLLSDA